MRLQICLVEADLEEVGPSHIGDRRAELRRPRDGIGPRRAAGAGPARDCRAAIDDVRPRVEHADEVEARVPRAPRDLVLLTGAVG